MVEEGALVNFPCGIIDKVRRVGCRKLVLMKCEAANSRRYFKIPYRF